MGGYRLSTRYHQQTVLLSPRGSQSPSLSLRCHLLVLANRYHCSVLCWVTPPITKDPLSSAPPFGNTGLSCQMRVIFSRNPSKGERSEMLLPETSSHFKLINPASGDMSEMLLWLRSKRVNPVRLARGDISDISLLPSMSHPKLVNPASGDMSDIGILLLPRFSIVKPVKLAKGVRSDISEPGIYRISSFGKPTMGDKSDIELPAA